MLSCGTTFTCQGVNVDVILWDNFPVGQLSLVSGLMLMLSCGATFTCQGVNFPVGQPSLVKGLSYPTGQPSLVRGLMLMLSCGTTFTCQGVNVDVILWDNLHLSGG